MFTMSYLKVHHLTDLRVWSTSWGILRMRLPSTHFQQILNENHTKFSAVHFAAAGLQNNIAIEYRLEMENNVFVHFHVL
jgi:hypothetical protein